MYKYLFKIQLVVESECLKKRNFVSNKGLNNKFKLFLYSNSSQTQYPQGMSIFSLIKFSGYFLKQKFQKMHCKGTKCKPK